MKKTILALTVLTLCNFGLSGKTAAQDADSPDADKQVSLSQSNRFPYELNDQNFFNNQITIQVPSTFSSASRDQIMENYPDPKNYPKVVLTDRSKRPMLALNITQNVGDRQDIIHMFRDIKNDIRYNFPSARFLRTDVIRNRTLAIIEVVMPNHQGENVYNMMAFKYVGSQFFFLNFSCPEDDMGTWQDTAREIAETIKINN